MWLKVLLYVVGLVNLAYGCFAMVAPADAAKAVGFALTKPQAHGEIRALYGGLLMSLGVVTFVAVWKKRPAWLAPLGFGFAGLAVGRLVSLAFDGVYPFTWGAAIFEGLAAVVFLYSSVKLRT